MSERAKRLLVPLISGTVILMPIMTFIADRFNYGYTGGFFEHYSVFFTKYTDLTGADGGFSFGQFWFLLFLFVISVVTVGAILLLKKKTAGKSKGLPFP
ncbi:MAG: acyltransferase family protein, partial [Ruminiclostridium sp.]|nr:acyltransferase family protein [Ruminiclostridium sp.]